MTTAAGAGITLVLRRAFTGTTGLSSPSSLSQAKETVVAATVVAAPPPPPPPQPDGKPAHDVVAGAMARAASQSTIHPLDTMKVRMQAGHASSKVARVRTQRAASSAALKLQRNLVEVRGLYKGVVGAATGAGIIIGTYFAFYSTTKRMLRERTTLGDGATAFVAGAAAALGSSVVKVPLAVCIRSVQAGVYKNVGHAARSIVAAAGVRGLFTGFVPTILEDVPDMAVKFAVYEMMRKAHTRLSGGRPAHVAEDLLMGGFAGAAAAAATTPLDVVKTVMMCTASSRPTLAGAARSVMREGKGVAPFFRGVGPRALSNGLNSAIFFCFFEAIRQSMIQRQAAATAAAAAEAAAPRGRGAKPQQQSRQPAWQQLPQRLFKRGEQQLFGRGVSAARPAGSAAACLTMALPLRIKQ